MDDNSLMPFGKHKGKTMVEVPDEYLLWFWGENKANYNAFSLSPHELDVMNYIEDCFDEKDLQ